MTISVSEDLTDAEVVSFIEDALVAELGVHPADIAVVYDSDTGDVTYTITSDDAESLVKITESISEEGFESSLDIGGGVSIDSFSSASDVIVTVDITVDASDVADVDSATSVAVDAVEELDTGLTIRSEGNLSWIETCES